MGNTITFEARRVPKERFMQTSTKLYLQKVPNGTKMCQTISYKELDIPFLTFKMLAQIELPAVPLGTNDG